mgnify:CR=1 FL=1
MDFNNILKIITICVLALHTGIANAQDADTITSLPPKVEREVSRALQGSICDPILDGNIIKTDFEAGATAGRGDFAPMWHFNNRQGAFSADSEWAYARAAVEGKHVIKSQFGIEWGVDIIGGHNLTSSVFIQQAYADVRWRMLKLSVGQKERWNYIQNARLSTGALTESGNARPIPQIRFEMPDYWNIPCFKDWVAIRGHIAYGWFTDGHWQKGFAADSTARATGVRYHTKAGFLRIGNEKKFPLTAEIGLHMATQFGGTTYNAKHHAGEAFQNPTRFKDFLLAFIPLSGDSEYDSSDQMNVAGNVLGSWLGAITWNEEKWKLELNYEHAFNDHSQMFWEYGLWTEQLIGIAVEFKEFKWIRNVNDEYFNLKNQSGYHDSTSQIPDQISCIDNNYNHGKYPGWFNYGQMIATPLCTSPIYNKDHTLICYNNRVEAFHAGVEGDLLTWLDYRLLITHSNNWGTYKSPFKDIKNNTSGLVELTFKPMIPGGQWSITTSFAFDNGDLYGNNYGGMITIKRCGIYNISKERK